MRRLFTVLFSVVVFSMFFYVAQARAGGATIEKGKKVSFNYTLTVDGKVMESSEAHGPLQYVQGEGVLLPALEKAGH
jgi:hypothetical protein